MNADELLRRQNDLEARLIGIKREIAHVTGEARHLSQRIEQLVNERHELLNRWRKLRDAQNRTMRMLEDVRDDDGRRLH